MRRYRLLSSVLLLVALAAAISETAHSAEGDQPQSTAAIDELIEDLDSEQFALRKQATRALIDAGAKAVGPLSAAARGGTLEVQTRVVRILQEMFAGSEDDETTEVALVALKSLAESSNRSLASRADRVLIAFKDLRRQRALAQIERLGGAIKYSENPFTNPNFQDPNSKLIRYILLGSNWKGKDAGLKYVKRVTRLRYLYISASADSPPITKEAQKELQAAMPNLIIEQRGRAYLGVGCGPHPSGCQIITVEPDTAAANAGLRVSDVITGFGGKKVTDFRVLIGLIKNHAPGEKVKVEVLRGGRKKMLEVVMGEWK